MDLYGTRHDTRIQTASYNCNFHVHGILDSAKIKNGFPTFTFSLYYKASWSKVCLLLQDGGSRPSQGLGWRFGKWRCYLKIHRHWLSRWGHSLWCMRAALQRCRKGENPSQPSEQVTKSTFLVSWLDEQRKFPWLGFKNLRAISRPLTLNSKRGTSLSQLKCSLMQYTLCNHTGSVPAKFSPPQQIVSDNKQCACVLPSGPNKLLSYNEFRLIVCHLIRL